MDEIKKAAILGATKTWFREVIAKNHVKNTALLTDPHQFNINPFLIKYLARFLTGRSDARAIAKALIYPRVLGSSINTSFGTNVQKFVSDVLGSFGSVIAGIDIEFIDHLDGRKKYCQVKLGPNTINKDDVETIVRHFSSVRNLARTNNLKLEYNDLIVGVLYGEPHELSAHYKKIEQEFHCPVYSGENFWERLTGDPTFYHALGDAISDVATAFDGSTLLEETIAALAECDEIKALADSTE